MWRSPHSQQATRTFVYLFVCVLTLSLYFICAPSPDNSPGLQLNLKGPSLWPLGLLRIKQCQYCAQLQVSVQVVHLSVVVHPRNGSVGKEAWGPSHVHFPRLLSVSSQNNLLSPGLDRDTYSRRRGGKPMKQRLLQGLSVCQCCTHITEPMLLGGTCFKSTPLLSLRNKRLHQRLSDQENKEWNKFYSIKIYFHSVTVICYLFKYMLTRVTFWYMCEMWTWQERLRLLEISWNLEICRFIKIMFNYT